MVFSPRLRQILLIMLEENDIVSVKNLADKIKVSKRTVQRELECTALSLKKYGISLQTKTGIGIWLTGEETDKKKLLEALQAEDIVDSADKEERRKRLILEILKDRTPKKLYYYGNIFGVSEATISNDMEVIEEWFHQFDLTIMRKQGYGVVLEGSEKNYRLAVRKFIDENIDSKLIKNLFEGKERTILEVIGNKKGDIYNLLNDDILKQVITCFLSIQDKRILRLTENSYVGLILHVTIAINRILQQEIIEPNEELQKLTQRDDDYNLALHIVNSLEEEFQIEIPDIEIDYICLHIKGAKLQYVTEDGMEGQSQREREELLNFINEMIEEYDDKLSYELKQDEEFIVGLLAHLQPTFVRLGNQMNIYNPLLEQIKETYPEIFQKCMRVGELIERRYSYKVPEAEVGFLAMHFGAASVRLENQKENKRKVEIGIVCASGIGISRLMLTKLKRFLRERAALMTFGKEDLTPVVLKRVDFLISSIDLNDVAADIIRVSPLLPEEDLVQIESKVRLYEKTPKKKNVETEFSSQLETVNFVVAQIKSMIKDFQCMKVNNDIGFDELLMAVTEKLSPYNEKRILIQEDIKRREQIATQIVPELDFALLHTRTKGVIKPSFSICLTKDLKAFSDPYFKSIHVVIIMLLPDDENIEINRRILGHLSSSLIEDEEFLSTIFGGDKEEIKGMLAKQLKIYFNQYIDGV
ncbi:BglG family transcription antiterminator [Konateibacter massiliensis]|uniref:BglG family transcription antiterminator n=1 Tax=Konateibacter massiliensis TaxID=2002841 RepID=UPI000C14E838|nr:BglG family transcription antiterminator [Konateibacter massiliensis]